MSDLEPGRPARQLQILRRKHEDSNTMLAIIMANIAGLFILGIVVAYNYANDTSVASNPNPPATSASAPPATTGVNRPSETTGSGNAERPVPVTPDKSQKQR